MKCSGGHDMERVGNISGVVYTSNPPQWDEVWVCDECREKTTIRVIAPGEWQKHVIDSYDEIKQEKI